ncbi:bacteriohemerythrin [Rhodospirillum sp. A1_3_36]|uniref:bacteriohemerythrin n=1 Tax=Rhodospirillum sp. A1_3_36 TaxID=3391666 RepID=UPI0039A771B4
MINIDWSPAFQMGVGKIDEAHAGHLELLKGMTKLIHWGESPSEIRTWAEQLHHDFLSHNQEEEILMANLGYPELTEHQAVHTFLSSEIGDQVGHFTENADQTTMMRAVSRIGHMLLDHMIRHDLTILTFMQGRGLTEARLGLNG